MTAVYAFWAALLAFAAIGSPIENGAYLCRGEDRKANKVKCAGVAFSFACALFVALAVA